MQYVSISVIAIENVSSAISTRQVIGAISVASAKHLVKVVIPFLIIIYLSFVAQTFSLCCPEPHFIKTGNATCIFRIGISITPQKAKAAVSAGGHANKA